VRTLVVSDLHLGALRGRSVLARPPARARLAAAVADCDRLVLLGDVVEMRERPLRDALAGASRVLPELVSALAPGADLVVVPGNHDHGLTRVGEARAGLEALLGNGAAVVSFAYPGLWLRDDVYAMHGHYLDRHTTTPAFERLGAGVMARVRGQRAAQIAAVEDYERVLAPIYAWITAMAETATPHDDVLEEELRAPGDSSGVLGRIRSGGIRGRALALGIRGLTRGLSLAGLGPLDGDLSGPALRRASLQAFAEVLHALGLHPAYAIYGHSHRAGPLPDDELGEWVTVGGTHLINSGSWVDEPLFLGPDPATSPYRPGFAVRIEDSGPPRLVNLLDD
jgi:UDP-2,3-diacylglucosamine pyrophosphatase LpxH